MEFNSLPLVVHLEIFSHLPVGSLMKIRLVCRLWNDLINAEFKFKQLRCSQSSLRCNRYDFHFTTKSFMEYTRKNPKFSQVKYLSARLLKAGLEDALDFLNSFKCVERISFVCFAIADHRFNPEVQKKALVVKLDRLQKAKFKMYWRSPELKRILLDLPRLVWLAVDSLERISLGYPQRLRTLVIQSPFRGEPDYSKFTGLTKLNINRWELRSISVSFIERLPSLREIHLVYLDFSDFFGPNCCLTELPLGEKAKPKIFYLGFEVSEIELEGEQRPHSFGFVQACFRCNGRNYYRSVDNTPLVDFICFNSIASELNDTEMFDVMLQKFPKIRDICISGNVANQSRLLMFVDKFKVNRLFFERTSLPPSFFQRLAENRPFIRSLVIRNEPSMNILSGDFDFVFSLNNLTNLTFTESPLALNFMARVLKHLKSIICITFSKSYNIHNRYCNYKYMFQFVRRNCQNVIKLRVEREFYQLSYKISAKEVPELINVVKSRLKADDGFVNPKQLQILLRHLDLERQTHLFMMRMYVYEQRNSICLSQEHMRLLNFPHWE